MELNNDNIPEGKIQELQDMAYNVLPEGADYDVFSENASKEIKPTLLYDDISLKQPEKKTKQKNENGSTSYDKVTGNGSTDSVVPAKDGGTDYDMFAENEGTVKEPDQNINREYLDVIFQGGIDLSKDGIRLTRSEYIAAYNRTNEYYDKEEKKCIKNFLWVAVVFAFGIAVLYIIELLQLNTPVYIVPRVPHPIYRILNGFRAGVFVANPVISGFLLMSTIKSIKKAKASRKKALDRLEQRKQELMLLGLYDTAN